MNGNVYIADANNHKVRMVNSLGIITTIAGTGKYGDAGDTGPATLAKLMTPYGVCADIHGNVYIADQGSGKIRMVSSDGIITTLANTGSSVGEIYVDSSGKVYFVTAGSNRVGFVNSAGSIIIVAGGGDADSDCDNCAATSAQLNSPQGVSKDSSGNVYIGDSYNHKIRRVTSTGIITTFAGTGEGGYSGDGGKATSAQLHYPSGVSSDSSGNVYIADYWNSAIRLVSHRGIITTFAGTGSWGYNGDFIVPSSAQLGYALGVTVDSSNGNVYIGDTSNHRIRMVVRNVKTSQPTSRPSNQPTRQPTHFPSVYVQNIVVTYAGGGTGTGGDGDGGPASSAAISLPQCDASRYSCVAADTSGRVYFVDNNKIRVVSSNGIITTLAGTENFGTGGDGGPAALAQLDCPQGIAVDNNGNVFIALSYNHKIRMVNSAGIISTFAGTGWSSSSGDGRLATLAQLSYPAGVAVDGSGNVFIADKGNNKIRMVNSAGIINTFAGSGMQGSSGDGALAVSAQFNDPIGIAVDGSGNVYIADTYNNKIRMVNSAGIITTYAGTGTGGISSINNPISDEDGPATAAQLFNPTGVAVDGSTVYIAESNNNKVRVVNSVGIITTFAGTGSYGFRGDGGPAAIARFDSPADVAVDNSGRVYIADAWNGRIRMVYQPQPSASPTLVRSIATTPVAVRNDDIIPTGQPSRQPTVRPSARDQQVIELSVVHCLLSIS